METLFSVFRMKDRVSGKYLGWFRIGSFALIAYEIIQFSQRGYLKSFLVDSRVRFPYELVPVSVELTIAELNMVLGIIILSAAMCSIGLLYRYAKWSFLISFSFLFFQDKMLWNNHWYLFLLVAITAVIIDLSHNYSVDSFLNPKLKQEYVPRWQYQLLALQLGQAYFFGGIAKINFDWLVLHQPISIFLEQRTDYMLIGSLFSKPWAGALFAWSGMLFDLTITFLLLNRITFRIGLVLSLIFNLFNSIVFDIGMFPYFMMFGNVLFFGAIQQTDDRKKSVSIRTQQIKVAFLALFFAFQALFPLRQFFFNGNPSWIGITERFSWRMMIQTKDVETFKFYAVDNRNGNRQEIDPSSFLFPQQMIALVVFPDMLPPVAKHMKSYFAKTGLRAFEVHAEVKVSMNGREFQQMVDQEISLSNYKIKTFSPPSYVIPLK